jgi:hypothetical protein
MFWGLGIIVLLLAGYAGVEYRLYRKPVSPKEQERRRQRLLILERLAGKRILD